MIDVEKLVNIHFNEKQSMEKCVILFIAKYSLDKNVRIDMSVNA